MNTEMKRIVFICLISLVAIPMCGQNKYMERKINQLRRENISETIRLRQMEASNKKLEDALKETRILLPLPRPLPPPRLPDSFLILNNPTLGLDEDIRNTIEETDCDSCKLVVNALELDTLSGEIEKEALFHILQVKQGAKINNDTTNITVMKHTGIYPRSGLYPEGFPTYEINVECYRTGMPIPEHAAEKLALQVAKRLIPGHIEFSTPTIPKGGVMLTVPSHPINNTPKQ